MPYSRAIALGMKNRIEKRRVSNSRSPKNVSEFSGIALTPREQRASARNPMKVVEMTYTVGHGLLHTHNPQRQEEPMASMSRAQRCE
jgi:hypothetical protein